MPTMAMAMGILLMVFPVKVGKRLLAAEKNAAFILDRQTVQERVPWGILYLFRGGFTIAVGFGKTGLDQWSGHHLAGVANLPIWLVVLLICLGVTFLTEVTSNTVTTTMILPVIAAAAVAAAIHPLLLMVPATLAASFAFMLPMATPPNAIIYSSGWVTIQKLFRIGLFLNLLGAILITETVLLLVQLLLI